MLRILLADDHPVVRSGLKVLIEQRPEWTVVGEANNGREAVDLAKNLKPDVVVLDLLMPELNGVEATRLIRAEVPETEVLVFTFQDSEELAAEVLAAGARGYVLKGDPPEDFLDAIESLGRHTPFFTRRVTDNVVQRLVSGRPYQGGRLALLTARERQIVQLVAEGHRTRDVANMLGISEKTVETHRAAIMRKLQLQSVAELVRYAVRNNIVQA